MSWRTDGRKIDLNSSCVPTTTTTRLERMKISLTSASSDFALHARVRGRTRGLFPSWAKNLVTSLRPDNQSSRLGWEGGEGGQERNLTYQLASRSEGLTPRGPLTVRRFVFEVWEPRHRAYSRFITSSSADLSLSLSLARPVSASCDEDNVRGARNASGQVKEGPRVRIASEPMADTWQSFPAVGGRFGS